MTTDNETATRARRTIRRYAHELFPEADVYEVRPLSVEVPRLYAMMLGLAVHGTGWPQAAPIQSAARIQAYVDTVQIALLADALQQGLTGDEAWSWVEERMDPDGFEIANERAFAVLGEDVAYSIKPYPCGPTPTHHDHLGPKQAQGFRFVTRVEGAEDAFPDCTEPLVHGQEPS
ncbi:MAG: hypothetical protein GC157_18520 [Frankiales bacterium]|nr:hypothetical protein [Frankiales bacterium]